MFQFYCSAIKSDLSKEIGWTFFLFQFYCSAIKSTRQIKPSFEKMLVSILL